ncbi:ribonuclease HII [Patescibacteria group bacterium]|nr:ribonuclease HII [Patescibacteria group bacterium]
MPAFPNIIEEKKLHQQGYKNIAGIDEAGCGCWAGPLVCGVVVLSPDFANSDIKDSKLLSSQKREELYAIIQAEVAAWSAGQASATEIDALGLTKAKSKAVERALDSLPLTPDYLLCDGNISVSDKIPATNHIKGDRNILSIACASIIAKVTRDRIIAKLGQQYPEYNFARHKGYGTKEHQEALQKHGVCAIHRKSYKPIAAIIKTPNL